MPHTYRFNEGDEDGEEGPIFEDEETYLEEVRIGKMYIDAQVRLSKGLITPKEYEDEIAQLNRLYDDDFKEDYEYTDEEIEQEYKDAMEMFQNGEITREERDARLHELDDRFGDMIAEKNGISKEDKEDEAEREYFENCDRLLDERFERDSDYC